MRKLTQEEFIQKAKEVHGDKYDYSLVEYEGTRSKIKIICPIHGIFIQKAHGHYSGQGCSLCYDEIHKYNQDEWVKKASKIHKNFYDYSLVKYNTSRTKVEIICPIHGIFSQVANEHINKKSGCPRCSLNKLSKGEKEISKWLDDKNIPFLQQYKYDNCINNMTKYRLSFDFYLPEHNTCIEYDGVQHFIPTSFGTDKTIETKLNNLKGIQNRDTIKNHFCLENNIKLIRISYKESVSEVLSKHLSL